MRERLHTPVDLEAEATALAQRLEAEIVKHNDPVKVTVGRRSGKVRRNSVCPCGSGRKYKKCCLSKVDDGQLPRLQTRGRPQRPPTKRVRPKNYHHNLYSGRPETERHQFGTYIGDRVALDGTSLKGERADLNVVNTQWVLAQFSDLAKFGLTTKDRLAYGRHKFPLVDWKLDPPDEWAAYL